MGRGYQLWVTRDAHTGRPVSCGATPLGAAQGPRSRGPQSPMDSQNVPWSLLLAWLNLDRRIQPVGWPTPPGGRMAAAMEAHATLPILDGRTWDDFARTWHVPYLRTEDAGRPVLWARARTGAWFGFLLHFGLQPGQWNWWVAGQPLRWVQDPRTGRVAAIALEQHAPGAESVTLDDVEQGLPAEWSDPDPDTLTLREILEDELRQHAAAVRNRCRLYVYPFESPAHGDAALSDTCFGLQSVAAVQEALADCAWTWLSPQASLWAHELRASIGTHVAGDPNVESPATAAKLARLTASQKYAMTTGGVGGWPGWGDPFAALWARVQPSFAAEARGAARIIPTLQRLAADTPARSTDGVASEARRWAQAVAHDQLLRASTPREYAVTTDVVAAVAWLIQRAVEAKLTLRACPHPGCGQAFIREEPRAVFCPVHRSAAARQVRSRRQAEQTD